MAERIGRLDRALAVAELEQAYVLASGLRRRLGEVGGGSHPYVGEVRALEGVLARLVGRRRGTVVLALAVARVHCRGGDPRAADAVVRAAAAWRTLDDERAVRAHGRELLELWGELQRQELLPAAHADLAEEVRRYLDAPVHRASTERGTPPGTLG
ncbi:hypothetical protein ACQEWB_22225 [Streptomyces sp. CA-249302]|uniref:hypothetical protein n=1 Tax=Streptomyces sp. CA-249302 TaxID=3240058 RepID=UPI003D919A2B